MCHCVRVGQWGNRFAMHGRQAAANDDDEDVDTFILLLRLPKRKEKKEQQRQRRMGKGKTVLLLRRTRGRDDNDDHHVHRHPNLFSSAKAKVTIFWLSPITSSSFLPSIHSFIFDWWLVHRQVHLMTPLVVTWPNSFVHSFGIPLFTIHRQQTVLCTLGSKHAKTRDMSNLILNTLLLLINRFISFYHLNKWILISFFSVCLFVFCHCRRLGERDTGKHRQNPGQCRGSEEETQCHPFGPADGRE